MSNNKYVIRNTDVKKKHRTKLSDIIIERGISQAKLAENSDLEKSQISNIVTGLQTDMFLNTAKKICNALDVSLDEVFGEGRVDYKTQILKYIDREFERLGEGDVYGKVWLEKFKKAVLNIKP